MNKYDKTSESELIMVIVNFGLGSKVLKTASINGGDGGIIFLGKGTMRNRINEFLGLDEIRKEIVVIYSSKEISESITTVLVKDFNLSKPNQGIALIMPLTGLSEAEKNNHNKPEGEKETMYTSVMTIVNKGKAELVMDVAVEAGARGGTIINARGAAQYNPGKLFHMDIEPEREIVMILAEVSGAEKIVTAIRDKLGIEEKGNGVIFCQDVSKVYGIY